MVEPGCKARLLLLRIAVPGGHLAPPWVWLCAGMWDGGHSAESKGLSVWDQGFQKEKTEGKGGELILKK